MIKVRRLKKGTQGREGYSPTSAGSSAEKIQTQIGTENRAEFGS